ncbi:MAG: imidazoleglycerol-phosphate dehydratase, partial [Opitutales bacterium]
LELFARHGLFDLTVKASGDLQVDYHHTVEDVGIVLGEAFKEALGEKRGIRRYGFFLLPMDECLAQVALDLSNRPFLVYQVEAETVFVRDFNIHLFREFFQAFANSVGANLHLRLVYGNEPHHIAEGLFKGWAHAMRMACERDLRRGDELPSTKGKLT